MCLWFGCKSYFGSQFFLYLASPNVQNKQVIQKVAGKLTNVFQFLAIVWAAMQVISPFHRPVLRHTNWAIRVWRQENYLITYLSQKIWQPITAIVHCSRSFLLTPLRVSPPTQWATTLVVAGKCHACNSQHALPRRDHEKRGLGGKPRIIESRQEIKVVASQDSATLQFDAVIETHCH